MINKLYILGRLTKEVELKMAKELEVAKFTVATNRGYGDKQTTEFVNCIAFGKTAANIAKFVKKGHLIHIEGYLKTSKWIYQEKTYYRVEAVVEKATFLPNTKKEESTEEPAEKPKAKTKTKAKKK